jgi:phospholipid/cholesterol/gamma-HCH transport system substrate-binding protein
MTSLSGRIKAIITVALFFSGCAAVFLWFLQGTATRVPILEDKGYIAKVKIRDVDNIVPASKIREAGVEIGEVRTVTQAPGGVLIEFAIELKGAVPLHQGIKVRIGNKSLIGDSYLEIIDGTGAPLPDGSTLPEESVELSTQLDDVIHDLNPPTRAALGSMLRSTGVGTKDTKGGVDATMGGLGDLGRQGHTALDALTAQTADLRTLGRNTAALMDALDTGQGQIATLVSNAQLITNSVAGQHQSLEATMRKLPGVLQAAKDASGKVTELSSNLQPVAAGLREASPELNSALVKLRPTTKDLRELMPPLSGTLDRLPRTLDKLDTLSKDVGDISPDGVDILRDVDPMLRYIRPYGPEVAAFFADFNAVFKGQDEKGIHYARLMLHFNEAAEGTPVRSSSLGVYYNPLPKPGTGSLPGPFKGAYPKVERDPN